MQMAIALGTGFGIALAMIIYAECNGIRLPNRSEYMVSISHGRQPAAPNNEDRR